MEDLAWQRSTVADLSMIDGRRTVDMTRSLALAFPLEAIAWPTRV